MAGGPEDAAGDEVQIFWIFDGDAVVADGGAEDLGFLGAVGVAPGDDVSIGAGVAVAGFDDLSAAGDGVGGFEKFDVVVEFLVDRGPVGEAFGNACCVVGVGDGDGLLGAVAAGLDAEVLEPEGVGRARVGRFVRVADAIGMHGAM